MLHECLHESNQRFELKLTEQSHQVRVCRGYANDVAHFFEKLRRSEAREDYWIPLDLWSTDGPAAAEVQLRQTSGNLEPCLRFGRPSSKLLKNCGTMEYASAYPCDRSHAARKILSLAQLFCGAFSGFSALLA